MCVYDGFTYMLYIILYNYIYFCIVLCMNDTAVFFILALVHSRIIFCVMA